MSSFASWPYAIGSGYVIVASTTLGFGLGFYAGISTSEKIINIFHKNKPDLNPSFTTQFAIPAGIGCLTGATFAASAFFFGYKYFFK